MNRPTVLRFLKYGIAISKKQQGALTNPFFDFLATHEDTLYDLILSFLDPLYCCNKDRSALLTCWKSLGDGNEDDLRQGYGDDVARWKGVERVNGARVTAVHWIRMGFTGNLPAAVGELDGMKSLYLQFNEIGGHLPPEIGNLTLLASLSLESNCIHGPLPQSIGNLTSLTTLYLNDNMFSGAIPASLANLTSPPLVHLALFGNTFTNDDVPPDFIEVDIWDDSDFDPDDPDADVFALMDGQNGDKKRLRDFMASLK